ncbi:MAG: toxin-antitoxin system YwqK family antitoxin [Deferribacteraceae bacterium]|jgi:antitoxin component YwqK of YwqJK toxin-antitoxin module|nr:toxin-antitoxin system YwqK family antitoxin [Deferribacteraceae bacterium]
MKLWLYICLLIACGDIAYAANTAWAPPIPVLITCLPTTAPTITGYYALEFSESVADVFERLGDDLFRNECLNKIKASDATIFAIENFEQMRLEQFYVDKPYIDAFAELTAIPITDIEMLIANNSNYGSSAMFVSAVAQKMSENIMNSDMELATKEENISKILFMDDDISKAIYDNDLDGLFDIISCPLEMDAVMTYYYEDGELEFEGKKAGRTEGIHARYYSSGVLSWVAVYENGRMDGFYKSYYENGVLKSEGTYRNGEEYGIKKEYYENGALKSEGRYQKGNREGIFRHYYENGALRYEVTYVNGEIEEETFYNKDGTIR